MIKASITIFNFYLAMMDCFANFLSEKYPEPSLKDSRHYQTVIIQKIVKMFHSLNSLAKNSIDEVSMRCVLRGILDSVTTYSFIYQRDDAEDILFRHYLYTLDGWRVYKKGVIGISEDNEVTHNIEYACDNAIEQIEVKLIAHPYFRKYETIVKGIIQRANWKYESLQNPRGLNYAEMYSIVGFNASLIAYFQSYLSQFAHGLSLSNMPFEDSEQKNRILYETIPIADKFIQAICQSFSDKDILAHLCELKIIQRFIESQDFNRDDLAVFAEAIVRKDKTLLI